MTAGVAAILLAAVVTTVIIAAIAVGHEQRLAERELGRKR